MRHLIRFFLVLATSCLPLGCRAPVADLRAPARLQGPYEYEVFVVALVKSTAVDGRGNGVPACIGHKDSPYPEEHLGVAVLPGFSKRLLAMPVVTHSSDTEPTDDVLKAWASDFATAEFPAAWALGDPIQGHCWKAGGWASCHRAFAFPIKHDAKDYYETLFVTPDHARPADKQTLEMSFLVTVQPVEE